MPILIREHLWRVSVNYERLFVKNLVSVCLSVIIFCLLIDGTIPFETYSVRQEHLKIKKRKEPGFGVRDCPFFLFEIWMCNSCFSLFLLSGSLANLPPMQLTSEIWQRIGTFFLPMVKQVSANTESNYTMDTAMKCCSTALQLTTIRRLNSSTFLEVLSINLENNWLPRNGDPSHSNSSPLVTNQKKHK